MFLHQVPGTGCPARPKGFQFQKGEQGRFVTPMSEHQSRDTGFLARRGLGVLAGRFSSGWEVDRGDRVAGELVGLRLEAVGLADPVVVLFTGFCPVVFEARLSAASLAARASLRRRLFR